MSVLKIVCMHVDLLLWSVMTLVVCFEQYTIQLYPVNFGAAE